MDNREFQSTLPVRGATRRTRGKCGQTRYFNPRSPCGERRRPYMRQTFGGAISIHAPRAGSDQTTGACRRCRLKISIHAPRAGSDDVHCQRADQHCDFNPRSPCGERQQTATKTVCNYSVIQTTKAYKYLMHTRKRRLSEGKSAVWSVKNGAKDAAFSGALAIRTRPSKRPLPHSPVLPRSAQPFSGTNSPGNTPAGCPDPCR